MKKTLSVAELIDLLRQQDQALPVWADGCDCANRVTGIVVEPRFVLGDGVKLYITVDTREEDYYDDEDDEDA